MNTTFQEIYKLFLNSINDYHIRNLFKEDVTVAEDLLYTLLLRSIPKFYNCVKDIKNVDAAGGTFLCQLDVEECNILSELMVCAWLDLVINDIRQMNLHLSDNDFKHFSEESNLRQKSEYCDRVREKATQDMVNYGLYRTDFSAWGEGDYGV